MLLKIVVENFMSYNQRQELVLFSKYNEMTGSNINTIEIGELAAYKSAVIFGANASGKSNLFKAVSILQTLLNKDLSEIAEHNANYHPIINVYHPFFQNNKPCRIGIVFSHTNSENIFEYEVLYDSTRFYEEKLILMQMHDANNNEIVNKEHIIFHREYIDGKYNYNIPDYKIFYSNEDDKTKMSDAEFEFIKQRTKDDRMFLKHLDDNGLLFAKYLKWSICNGITVRYNPYDAIGKPAYGQSDLRYAANYYRNNHKTEFLLDNLHKIGLNKLQSVDTELAGDDGKITLGAFHGEDYKSVLSITSVYQIEDRQVKLDFWQDESDGTQKFHNYLALVDTVIQNHGTLVVDEIDNNFHPILVKHIIKMIIESNSRAQIIFTSHNVAFLDNNLFKKAQIWFAEKNDNCATELFSLADFTDVGENDDWIAEYLCGTLGAIPYLHELSMSKNNNH
jgi:AAA15 family ATPase/GTPase